MIKFRIDADVFNKEYELDEYLFENVNDAKLYVSLQIENRLSDISRSLRIIANSTYSEKGGPL